MQKCDKKDVEERRSNFKQILQSLKFKIILPKNNGRNQKIKPQNHAFPKPNYLFLEFIFKFNGVSC